MISLRYDIQVRIDGKWEHWVYRDHLSDAFRAKRSLMQPHDDPWWDQARVRPELVILPPTPPFAS